MIIAEGGPDGRQRPRNQCFPDLKGQKVRNEWEKARKCDFQMANYVVTMSPQALANGCIRTAGSRLIRGASRDVYCGVLGEHNRP